MARPKTSQDSPNPAEQFIELQARHQRQVFSYILTLVPTLEDAEQILIQTNLQLWRKFADYRPHTDFVNWANEVALAEVRVHQRRSSKAQRFDSDVVDKLVADINGSAEVVADQAESVSACLRGLSGQERALVYARYSQNRSINQLARRLECSPLAIAESLRKIRGRIFRCIRGLSKGRGTLGVES